MSIKKGLNQHRRWITPLLLAAPLALHAQPAATVPASSGIYNRLESVTAYYPVRGAFLGERGLSRREIERIVALLNHRLNADSSNSARRRWARVELDAISDALASRRGRVNNRYGESGILWRGDMFSSRTTPVRITPNSLGEIDAVSNPYSYARHGWPAIEGSIASIAPTAYWSPRGSFAAVVQPLASLTPVKEGGWTSERLIHRGFLRGVFHNAALQVGPDERQWGQSRAGSMFISGNAAPLPALALGTDTSITLPWLLRVAGPFRMTAILADLGASQDPPHARLAAWQASIQPWSRFELGVAVAVQTGGNGGPPASFLERFVDLFPVIDALAPQPADLQISNKLAGGNLRLRIPELSGLDVYYELQIDDFDGRRLRSSFVDDAGHLLGVRLPLLINDHQVVARGEIHKTSLRQYEHAQFRSGYTYRERLIGNPLGPHARGGYLGLGYRWAPLAGLELVVADESRDPSQYSVFIGADRDRDWRFVRETNEPDYRARRLLLHVDHALPMGSVRLTIGHHRAWREGEAARGDWAGILTLSSQRLQTF